MNNDYIHYSTFSRRNQEGEWGGGAFFRQNRPREDAPSRTGSTEGFAKKYVKKPKTLLTKEQNCVIISTCLTPVWWNWQTRGTQNPVVAIPCGFDPHHRHQRIRQVETCRIFLSKPQAWHIITARSVVHIISPFGAVSHHALACIYLRLDDIQHFVLVICNSCGIDNMQDFVLMICTAAP